MSRVSVLVPARDEPYLARTVAGLLESAAGDVEVIVVLDGWHAELPPDKRVVVLENSKPMGRRACTNIAARVATGKWLMKIDAHCIIQQGYDEVLQADCADNWIMVPKRFNFDAPNWQLIDQRIIEEAMRYLYPYKPAAHLPKFTARPWPERAGERAAFLVDEDMSFQGSCWFMSAAHWKRIGGMNEHGYGTFQAEPEEIGLKTQLGPWDGKVMRNKKIWYGHWAKPKEHWRRNGSGWIGWVTEKEWWDGWKYASDFWFGNQWKERGHDFEYLIDRFWPIPDWPEDWKTHCKRYIQAVA